MQICLKFSLSFVHLFKESVFDNKIRVYDFQKNVRSNSLSGYKFLYFVSMSVTHFLSLNE